MTDQPLSEGERQLLLTLARQTIERVTRGGLLPEIDLAGLPPRLAQPGVCFVTLTTHSGALRGCIGALEVRLPMAQDVCQHAAAAALEDYRFMPVRPEEVDDLLIEISCLTQSQPLLYQTPDELLQRLRPMQDGVVLHDGPRRATFLPQVWEKLPDPAVFLSNLCQKMGASPDLWKRKHLDVEIYRVEKFQEALNK